MNKNSKKEFQVIITDKKILPLLNKSEDLYKIHSYIDWDFLEKEISKYYIDKEKPEHLIRFLIGFIMLDHMFGKIKYLTVDELWVANPNFQYFTGEVYLHKSFKCDLIEIKNFIKVIGKEGKDIILYHFSIALDKIIETPKKNNKKK